jgi:hypothetical protein
VEETQEDVVSAVSLVQRREREQQFVGCIDFTVVQVAGRSDEINFREGGILPQGTEDASSFFHVSITFRRVSTIHGDFGEILAHFPYRLIWDARLFEFEALEQRDTSGSIIAGGVFEVSFEPKILQESLAAVFVRPEVKQLLNEQFGLMKGSQA